jgi:esterase/lipase superfamily enzyme
MENYNIDRDITLYSYAELETMKRILLNKNANHSAVPFRLNEIETELEKRK